MNTQKFAQDYAFFYDSLTAQTSKEEYASFFNEASTFQDPFQKVQGLDAIHNIFVDMYKTLHQPKFKILETVCDEKSTYIQWTFEYAMSPIKPLESFTGVSRVTFDEHGKVLSHIDYWDAAENIYEKIPLLGSLIRIIKRKIHA